MLVSHDMKDEQFLCELRREMSMKGPFMAFMENIPVTKRIYTSNDWNFMARIIDSSAKVFIIYGDNSTLTTVSIAANDYLTTQKVWITTAQWDASFSPPDHFLDTYHKSLSFAHQNFELPSFRQFLRTVNPSKYPEDFFFASNSGLRFSIARLQELCVEKFWSPHSMPPLSPCLRKN